MAGEHIKEFDLASISVMDTPATDRIVISRRLNGTLRIQSTMEEEETINFLDEAMEAIDGQRLPPAA